MKKVPTATEIAVKCATELERMKLLAMAKECKNLEEFIEYLEKLTKS